MERFGHQGIHEPVGGEENFIRLYRSALAPDVCAEIMRRFDDDARVRSGTTGGGVRPAIKTSADLEIQDLSGWEPVADALLSNLWFFCKKYLMSYPHVLTGVFPAWMKQSDGEAKALEARELNALSTEFLERYARRVFTVRRLNIQRYTRRHGGYFHWHYETFPSPGPYDASRRVLFLLYYLNDVLRGGQTEFHYQGASIQPRQGTLLIAPTGFTHTHRGATPESEDKYVLASWLVFQPTLASKSV